MATISNRSLLMLLLVVIVVIAGFAFLNMPDNRSTGQRVGDAIDALPQGVDKAGRQLERRTPGERIGDSIKDAGDNLKHSTDGQ